MSRGRSLLLLAASGLWVGCGPTTPPPKPMGTVVMRFTATDQVKTSPNLKSPLLGTFYGGIYLAEDVGLTGPRADAVQQGSVEVANIDLRTVTTSAASWTSPSMAPNNYIVLGFLDVNANGATTRDPDSGDPVTLALTNTFEITDKTEAKRVVVFELVFN